MPMMSTLDDLVEAKLVIDCYHLCRSLKPYFSTNGGK